MSEINFIPSAPVTQSSMLSDVGQLHKEFLSLSEHEFVEKYDIPFPLAVFGTLRSCPMRQSNAQRMFVREPLLHCKAFLPHFSPSGIWLDFHKGTTGVFEVYFYTPEDWSVVIKSVDALEGFTPHHNYGYNRTLMNVHLLPDDYKSHWFENGIRATSGPRDLEIPQEEWESYPKVPCWLYSNRESNKECQKEVAETSPILWWR